MNPSAFVVPARRFLPLRLGSLWLVCLLAFAAGLMLALPSGAGAATGVDWVASSTATQSFTAVTAGGGKFVAVGPAGHAMYSVDGVTWSAASGTGSYYWTDVAYGVVGGVGKFVAISSLQSGTTTMQMVSADGQTWSDSTLVSSNGNQFTTIEFGNGVFVAQGSGDVASRLYTSTDGTTWTSRNPGSIIANGGMVYGDSKFVGVSSDNKVITSTNGAAWASQASASGDSAAGWTDVAYGVVGGAGRFVAVRSDSESSGASTGAQVMTSPDGVAWTLRATPSPARQWQSVVWGGGLFVAVSTDGTGNRVMTSPDGITWTNRASAVDNAFYSITYFNGLFAAVGTGTPTAQTSGAFIPDVPSAPTVVVGDASATVTVAAGSGAAATSFTITASPGGATCTVTGASGSCTVTGLTNGTAYTFTATATNVGGTTVASPASLSVTPVAPAGSGSGGSGSGGSGAGGSGSGGSGSGGSGAVAPNLVIVLTPSRRTVAAGQTLTLRLDFSNTGTAAASGAKACVTIPEGFTVVDADGGTVTGNQICFNVGALAAPDAKVQARRAGRAPASSSTRRYNVVLRATTAVTKVVTFSTTVSATGVKPRTVVVKAKPIRIKPSRNASAESPTG